MMPSQPFRLPTILRAGGMPMAQAAARMVNTRGMVSSQSFPLRTTRCTSAMEIIQVASRTGPGSIEKMITSQWFRQRTTRYTSEMEIIQLAA